VLVLLLAVAGGIAGGTFWQRVRQGQQRLKRELETVANLEARAFLDRDRETYLSLQDQDDWNWYHSQEARFDPQLGDGYRLEPGQRAELAVTRADWLPVENRAWAEVTWAEEDGLYRRAQFYRKESDQWLRTGPRREYFGQQRTHETAHFAFKYLAREEDTVHWMAEQFEAWHAAVCADLGCAEGPRVNVLLTPDGEAGGDFRPPKGFILASPRVRGVREDGALLAEDRVQVARLLIYTLLTRHADGNIVPEDQPYLLSQLTNWELRRLGLAGSDAPPTPLLDAVMASHGLEGVRALRTAMAHTNSESLALRRALDADLADLGVGLGEYLTALLALERQMLEWQALEPVRSASRPLARRTFSGLLAANVGQWRTRKEATFDDGLDPSRSDPTYRPLARPSVARWELIPDSFVWAEVSYRDVVRNSRSELSIRRVEFFELENGDWRHTAPFSLPLGEAVNVTSEHFRIFCHEREVDFMIRELTRLERLYREIAGVLGNELLPGVRVLIEITSSTWATGSLPQADIYVPSPYLSIWSGEPGASYLAESVGRVLIEKLAVEPGLAESLSGPRNMWWTTTMGVWQYSFVETAPIDWSMLLEMEPLASAVRSGDLLSLSELEVVFRNEPSNWLPEGWTERMAELAYLEAVAVLGYIGETYGFQEYATLLQTLPEAESLADWLETALGVDLETFETDWKAWLREQGGG
jgi:hypothetical protein